ncbi:nuclear transport factor 2 family protein [Nocardia sp. NPDC088792]|uniref:nuclear transport factor 2 family protein n=1 Tax=Nocardia sp. NPDC088792 TaxID=3364332 RepID=UPI0038162041
MSAESNIKTVNSLYAAFVHGDVPGLLDTLGEDIDWATETTSTVAPWYGKRHGKEAVASFVQQLGSTMEVQDFTPALYAVADSDVLTVVHFRGRNRATGVSVVMDVHHRFTFRGEKIVYYRGTEDTAQIEASFHPSGKG